MNITREKNIYTFTLDNNKKVIFNTEEKYVIGSSGKQVKRIPTNVNYSLFAQELFKACTKEYEIFGEYRELFDRLVTLPKGTLRSREMAMRIIYYSNVDTVKANWKVILDFVENSEPYEGILGCYTGINNLIEAKKTLENVKKYQVEDLFSIIYRNSAADFLQDKIFRKTLKNVAKNKYEKIHNAIFELTGTNDRNILATTYGIHLYHYDKEREIGNLIYDYKKLKSMLATMGMNDFVISNIKEDYEYIKNLYETNRTEIENKFFASNQTKFNLDFENEDYEAYIPTTREELHTIGAHFHNCANGHEWNCYLSNGERYLVVIVEKNTNEMKVCCDISAKNNTIVQYLKECNNRVTDNSLLLFKKEYQDYLNGLREE